MLVERDAKPWNDLVLHVIARKHTTPTFDTAVRTDKNKTTTTNATTTNDQNATVDTGGSQNRIPGTCHATRPNKDKRWEFQQKRSTAMTEATATR